MPSIKFPHNLSKALDRAIARLEDGESVEHIVATSPSAVRLQLTEFLPIVAELRNIPLKQAPEAMRRYAFLNHTVEKASRFARFMRTLRTGYAISAAFAILMVVGVSTAAANSLPGSPLFSLKTTWENARISVVARNPGDRAQLELTLANQRLAEAQQVFSDQSSDASDKAQAVQELNTQTQVALNQIQQVASTPSITGNPGIIQNLVALTKNQASLQAQVDPSAASDNAAQNQKTIAAIQESVAAAANTQPAQIQSQQQAQANGVITAMSATSFTIDKNVFQITSSTQFFSANGLHLTQSAFGIGDSVSAIGVTSGEDNQAQVITLKQKAAVTTPAPSPTTTTGTTDDATANSIPTTVQQPAANVSGGFILESPDPQ
jgi:hypothetical protein